MALNIDIAPTLLEVAGAAPLANVHGRSLVPLLSTEPRASASGLSWRTSFLIERFPDQVFPRVADMSYRAVRTERWKYIQYQKLSGMDELYDLLIDPYEMKNVIHNGSARGALAQMKQELQKLLHSSGVL